MSRSRPIERFRAAGAVFALALAAGPDTRAQAPETGGGLDPQAWVVGGSSSVTRLQADLIRRGSGEWVIAGLRPSGKLGSDHFRAGASRMTNAGVHAALLEYERAFEQRDADRLATVLVMDPAERSRVRRLFDRSSAISVSIRDVTIAIAIDGNRGWLAFDQRMVVSRRPRREPNHRAQRTLFAHDPSGNWRTIVE